MPNPFAHVELNTDDVKKAKKFYQTVFAWKLNDLPAMGGYTMIDVSGGVGGGMQKKQSPDAPNYWLAYVQVDDVKATIAKAVKAGATALLPYQEIGDMGAIGIFVDPTGAHLGVWEAKQGAAEPPPAEEKPAKKAAKKASAKKAPAKAAPPPVEEKPAKKAAKKSPAKKAPAKAAPPPVEEKPVKKAAKKAPAKAAPAPAKKAPKKG